MKYVTILSENCNYNKSGLFFFQRGAKRVWKYKNTCMQKDIFQALKKSKSKVKQQIVIFIQIVLDNNMTTTNRMCLSFLLFILGETVTSDE